MQGQVIKLGISQIVVIINTSEIKFTIVNSPSTYRYAVGEQVDIKLYINNRVSMYAFHIYAYVIKY